MESTVLDGQIRKALDPVLNRIGTALVRSGVRANGITVAGFLLGAAAWTALAVGAYPLGLAFILANRIADGLDGAVARKLGPTDLGGYVDIVLDFLFYSGVPFFFAVGKPQFALPAAFLIFSFVGTGCSFLAFAAIAAKRGITTQARGRKSIYYVGGLTEGTETLAFFAAICLLPDLFAVLAWIFGAMCWMTTIGRIAAAYAAFLDRETGPQPKQGNGVVGLADCAYTTAQTAKDAH